MGKVVVMDHPLIQHKIGLMRRTETGSKDFRTLAGEVAMFECYEATRVRKWHKMQPGKGLSQVQQADLDAFKKMYGIDVEIEKEY